MEGGAAGVAACRHVGVAVQKQFRHRQVAVLRRPVERGVAVRAPGVGVNPAVEKQPGDLEVAGLGRRAQWGGAVLYTPGAMLIFSVAFGRAVHGFFAKIASERWTVGCRNFVKNLIFQQKSTIQTHSFSESI